MASRMWMLAVLLSVFVGIHIHGYSMQFGRIHAQAVPIYEAEIKLNRYSDYLDVVFKPKPSALGFIINMILVLDESDLEWRGRAIILSGGVGGNFTTLRLMYYEPEGGRVTVLIYGLPRSQAMLDHNTV